MWCNLVWCGVDGLDLVCNYWYDSVQMQSHFPAVALVKYPQSWYLSSTSSVHFFMTEQISKIFHPVSFGRQRSPPGWVKVYVTIQSLLSPISKVAAFAGLHLACAPERESVSFFSCIRCHFVLFCTKLCPAVTLECLQTSGEHPNLAPDRSAAVSLF